MYDWSDGGDTEVVVEDIERLNMDYFDKYVFERKMVCGLKDIGKYFKCGILFVWKIGFINDLISMRKIVLEEEHFPVNFIYKESPFERWFSSELIIIFQFI